MIKISYLILLIWLCLSQITLNQEANKQHQYSVKKIQTNRQSKDLKKSSSFNKPQAHQKLINENTKFSSRTNPFQDYLNVEPSEIILEKDETWNNDVVNDNWNENSWTPPVSSWQPESKKKADSWSPPVSSWQPDPWKPSGWPSDGWNSGWWWEQDPWKDPYKKTLLIKIKPEVSEVYAADVLIRENRNSNFGINGFVQFVQFENYVEVNGIICNLPPGKHAFHIHKFGEISNGCHETLGDFNPYTTKHGYREYKNRHLGDLGNIEANSTGIAAFRFKDKQIKLHDKVRGIIGRSVVIHEFEDDKGLTGIKESERDGDSGGRLACGVIGISQASNYNQLPFTCNRKN